MGERSKYKLKLLNNEKNLKIFFRDKTVRTRTSGPKTNHEATKTFNYYQPNAEWFLMFCYVSRDNIIQWDA